MKRKFLLSGLVATCAALLLHVAAHFLFLKGFFRSHPTGSPEFL